MYYQDTQPVMQHPSISILGTLGAGKTAVSVMISKLFQLYCEKNGLDEFKVFANFTINLPNFKKVKAHDIINFPDWLQNGILIIDEVHSENGDSYNFLGKIEKKLTTFWTQIRKRNLAIITTSQDFTFILPRIRRLTYYYIHAVKLNETETLMRIVSKDGYTTINEIKIDLTQVYDLYDTKEIITPKEIQEIEDLVKDKSKKGKENVK